MSTDNINIQETLKEQRKLLSKNEELIKQENALQREYTVMLRKLVSISNVLNDLQIDETKHFENSNKESVDTTSNIKDSTLPNLKNVSNDTTINTNDNKIPSLIPNKLLESVSDLNWYNDQIKYIRSLEDKNSEMEFDIPEALDNAWKIYKETPLYYNEGVTYDSN
ncbi:hypothetical protein TBLA_0C05160 [Henningerozyma blattae CBS 6284]|uniref:Uncharacterized protein n=1 Tax=Henningerozyma blattae (strain ATCC 34711 / CBS 6284 / DSM 70876 / NBRC 10599 / NRRL Y-10934 / UCD 77-7) TaxID=1071380 RepID=I2H1R0_HENB6|nr:hypothetical protein TBLA_0C05160 [Tetrapisispora blattae CBS 6284]CCH60312.1 hypothetical protein TBLA_0C05160 [Tetrapisispora blattae CBS 6284]